MGKSANKAISKPMLNSDACSERACRELVTLAPASAICAAIEMTISWKNEKCVTKNA
jgi:hypothetical protein